MIVVQVAILISNLVEKKTISLKEVHSMTKKMIIATQKEYMIGMKRNSFADTDISILGMIHLCP
jgi:hypothetical protein